MLRTILVADGSDYVYVNTDAPVEAIEDSIRKENLGEGSFITTLIESGYVCDECDDVDQDVETYYEENYNEY